MTAESKQPKAAKASPEVTAAPSAPLKRAIINFSGNVGKSTVARHLLQPRMPGAEYISVESINADDGDGGGTVRGKQFGQLQEQLMLVDSAVIDIGASNVEDYLKLMQQFRGSHEDTDQYIVPVVKETKQIKDTIATIQALTAIGVPANKIVVVFNKLETDDTVEDAFYPIFAFHEDTRSFRLDPKAVIQYSELYQRMRHYNTSIPELLENETDWKAQLRSADQEGKTHAAAMISMRRLALSAQENLDAVYAAIAP